MAMNVAQKLIQAHLTSGEMSSGAPIALKVDQTLAQDATGTLIMLTLEAMEAERAETEVSVQYIDHNLLQVDNRNPDDHLYLAEACRRFGIWYSRPGNGISHVVHMQRFGRPGALLLGADSHTPAAGSLGMLAIGAGGMDVAMAVVGEPFQTRMPEILGVRLVGRLPDWVSAKDVILELLRRRGVAGGVGKIIEYNGPGLDGLTAMDRHVIANMGAELGATSTVFPSTDETRRYLRSEGRESVWQPLYADADCSYDDFEEIDLSQIEPLIACPSSPANVVPVAELQGLPIAQAYIGSSANPGWRDFATAADVVAGHTLPTGISLDINPTSRQLLEMLIADGRLGQLIGAGARLHQTGCNGCIGMGQAPATGSKSLRTTPRNFPGRSGTEDDAVYLCSPETAAASALRGEITDPRTLTLDYPRLRHPPRISIGSGMLRPPPERPMKQEPEKGPNIVPLPEFKAPPERLRCPVALKLGDDVSTDEILPAGAQALPDRSNVEKISRFAFRDLAPCYVPVTDGSAAGEGHAIVAGTNYGQGSSREHAAIALRIRGLRLVLAKSFARIHRQNLLNFGVLPLTFVDQTQYEAIAEGATLVLSDLSAAFSGGAPLKLVVDEDATIDAQHDLSPREVEVILAGGLINRLRR